MTSAAVDPVEIEHRHIFGLHRHPNWHGHCGPLRSDPNWTKHTCRRWHVHFWWRHRHTETGR